MQRILIIKLGAFGDMVQALAPIRIIRDCHEDAHIILLTTPPFEEFARQMPYSDGVKIWQRNLAIWQNFSIISWLRHAKFDRVYDLQNNARTRWLFRAVKGRRLEWSGAVKGASLQQAENRRVGRHGLDRFADQLKCAGLSHPDLDQLEKFIPDTSWMQPSKSVLKRIARLRQPLALLVPGASGHRPEKRWPVHYYAQIAQWLDDQKIVPIIVGGPDEMVLAQNISDYCAEAVDLTGQTSLIDLVALGRAAKICVSNDTGPPHLIATTCPTLVLFSKASHPALSAPRGKKVEMLQEDMLENLPIDRVMLQMTAMMDNATENGLAPQNQ